MGKTGHDTLYSLILSILPLESQYTKYCKIDVYNYDPIHSESDTSTPEWSRSGLPMQLVCTIVKTLKDRAGFLLPEVGKIFFFMITRLYATVYLLCLLFLLDVFSKLRFNEHALCRK